MKMMKRLKQNWRNLSNIICVDQRFLEVALLQNLAKIRRSISAMDVSDFLNKHLQSCRKPNPPQVDHFWGRHCFPSIEVLKRIIKDWSRPNNFRFRMQRPRATSSNKERVPYIIYANRKHIETFDSYDDSVSFYRVYRGTKCTETEMKMKNLLTVLTLILIMQQPVIFVNYLVLRKVKKFAITSI